MKHKIIATLLLLAAHACAETSRPNIVLIMCDDLGYGDVQCLNPENGKIKTPCVDKLAKQGMIFTDAHSGSAVCTPTRYGLLTGRYSWRTRLQNGVATGFRPCLIAPDRLTVAGLLKKQGYATGIIGKWHLDFQYQDPKTGEILAKGQTKKGRAPIGATIPDGPTTRGFDYFHGIHHAGHMDTIIENDKVIEKLEEIHNLPRLTEKSVAYIEERAKSPEQPFFLYVPLGSPHAPIVPTKEWQGKSGLNAHADFVMQTDATVGAISDALEENGFADNTLFIFTSDNGTSKGANIAELREKGHHVSAHFRGSKADIWDGGHRVPFVVRWPGKVEPGSRCDQLITLVDFFATASEITGEKAPECRRRQRELSSCPIRQTHCIDPQGRDPSFHFRPLRLSPGQMETAAGQRIRRLVLPEGTRPRAVKLHQRRSFTTWKKTQASRTTSTSPIPKSLRSLLADLTSDVERGRSTDGPEAKNDVAEIRLWKSGRGSRQKKSAK